MMVGLAAGLVRGRVAGWLAVPGIAAAILLLVFSYDVNASGFVSGAGRLVAPFLAVSSLFAAVIWLADGGWRPVVRCRKDSSNGSRRGYRGTR